MKFIQAWKRRRTIASLARSDKCLSALMKGFTDERLANTLESKGPKWSDARLGEIIVNDIEYDDLTKRLLRLSVQAWDSLPNGRSGFLIEITNLVDLMASIVDEYDPDGTKYPKAVHSVPEHILHFIESIINGRHRDQLQLGESEDEALALRRALLTVTFLTHAFSTPVEWGTSAENYFIPEFQAPSLTSYRHSRILTMKIMENPYGDPIAYADEFRTRLDRRKDLKETFGEDFDDADLICDYPDHLIERVMSMGNRGWADINRLASMIGPDAARLEDFLDLVGNLPEKYQFGDLFNIVCAIDAYPQMQQSRLTVPAVTYKAQRESLLHISLTLQRVKNIFPIKLAHELIKDERLIDLIVDNPDHGAIVVDTIQERGGYDHDEMLRILDSGALGAGAL